MLKCLCCNVYHSTSFVLHNRIFVTVIEMYLITKQTIFLDKNVVIPPNFLLDESLPADMTITSVIHRVPCQPINPQ